jgi:hypothetical protein
MSLIPLLKERCTMEETGARKGIAYRYEKHPKYRVIFANGAVGGATPRGDIKFDLFIEYLEVPEETFHSITPDGIGPEVDRNPKNPPFTRQSQVGVIMNPGQAKSLAYWLMGQVDGLEKKSKAE